jgi:hypothetical protein
MVAMLNKLGEKRAKVKLTKEQKQFVQNLVKLENRVIVCREYIEIWMQFYRCFSEISEDKDITAAAEKSFFQCMTILARKHFQFVELMGDALEGGADIIKILSFAVSLSNIKMMTENSRDKLQLDWHNQFLSMNKALGRLLRLMPGDRPLTEVLANLKAMKPAEVKTEKPAHATAPVEE